MSDNVDEKVVQLRFDNKQFEANAQKSMSTLDKLKEKLGFKKTNDELNELNKTVQKTDLSPLGKAAEEVSVKFDALGIMAARVLMNITDTAMNTGKKLVEAFTIDPIKSGFEEYETQINAVQTILANTSSKGTTLEEVNEELDELNHYADLTIYNFTQMTRNIGTFTAAGVGLKESTSAIQGIANLAAVSGSNAQQASTAMYQLSQALAAGALKLQDWNSVVNAGMGGQVFQDALKKTAEVHGVCVDEMIKEEGSFRETLKKGWITADILTETLSKMTKSGAAEYLANLTGVSLDQVKATQEMVASAEDGSKTYDELAESMAKTGKISKQDALDILTMADTAEDAATKVKTFTQLMDTLKEAAQSGWTQTWEIIIGDFGEAKELFTEASDFFSDLINKSSDARNDLLEAAMSPAWDQLSKKIEDAGIPLDTFQDKLIEVARKHGVAIDKMIEEDGSFVKTLKRGWLNGDLISETIGKFIGNIDGASDSADGLADSVTNLGDVVRRVIRGDFGDGADRIKALTDAGYDSVKVQTLVNYIWKRNGETWSDCSLSAEEMTKAIGELSDAELGNIGFTDEQVQKLRQLQTEAVKTGTPINELIARLDRPSGRELLIDSVRNALKGLMAVINSVKEAWSDIFPPTTSEQVYALCESIHKLSEYLLVDDETADKLKRTFKGLFALIDIIRTVVGGAFTVAFRVIANVLGLVDVNVLDLTSSVGDAIVAFRDFLFENNKVINGIETVIGWISTACIKVKEWTEAFLALPEVQQKLTEFKAVLADVLKGFQDYFAGGAEKINEFIERIKAIDSISLDNIGAILKDFRDNVLGYFFDFDNGLGTLKETLSKFTAGIREYFNETVGILGEVKVKIFDFIDSVMKKYGSIAVGGLITVGFGAAILKFVDVVRDAFDLLGGITDGIEKVLKNVSNAIRAFADKTKAESILKYAEAIAILAGSLFIIAQIPADTLGQVTETLAALAGGMLVFSLLISFIPKVDVIKGVAAAMIAFAGGVLVLVIAIRKLNELNAADVVADIGPIGLLMTVLTGFTALLAKFAPELKIGAISVISMASAVLILVEAVKQLSEISIENMSVQGTVMTLNGIITALVILCASCKNMKLSEAAAIVAIVASIRMLVNTLNTISKFDVRTLMSSLLKISAVIGVLFILMKATKNAGQYAKEGGAGVLLMSAAMIVLAQAFKTISKIDSTTIGRSLGTISLMLVIFGGIVALSKFAGENAVKAGAMLLLMSGAIAILAGVMFGLSLIAKNNSEGLTQALVTIMGLEAMFAVLVGISKLATDCKGTIIALVSALGVMSVAIGILACLPTDGLQNATIALSAVIGMFTLLTGISKLATGSVKTILAITAAVAVLGTMIGLLASFTDTNAALKAAGAISILLVSLSAAFALMGKMQAPSMAALASLTGMTLIISGLSIVLGWLEKQGFSVSIENAIALSTLVLALSGALMILAGVGAVWQAAAIGAVVLISAIAAFGAIFAALGALVEQLDSNGSDIEGKIETMIGITEKIGEVVGSLLGGAFAGLCSGLPAIGQYMSDFTENLKPFLEDVQNVDGETLKSVASLVGAVLLLTAGEFISGIMNFLGLGTNLLNGSLGKDLCGFGNTLVEYAKVATLLSDEDIAAIKGSAEAAKALADLLDAVPNSGGWLATVIGDNTWSTFSDGLTQFGVTLVTYGKAVSALDSSNISAIGASVEAAKLLSDLLKSMPNSGGWLATVMGDNTWSTFGDGLCDFGKALVDYGTAVSNLDNAKINAIGNSIKASEKLNDLLKAMPNSGGWLATVVGDNTWETFGNGLAQFGVALVTYGTAVAQLDKAKITAIENSVTAATKLNDLLNAMPNSGGMVSWFTGDNTWEKFGKGLIDLAGTLKDYADKAGEIDCSSMDNVSESLSGITKLIYENSIGKDNEKALKSFKKSLSLLGDGIADFGKSMSKVDLAELSTSSSNLLNLVQILEMASGLDKSGIMTLKDGVKELGSISIDNFVAQFKGASEKIKMAGIDLVVLFIDGVNSKKSELTQSMADTVGTISSELVADMKNAEKTVSDQFMNSGYYIVQGLVKGIDTSTPFVKTAMVKLSETMQKTFREANDIHSPSRDYEEYGGYIDQGIVKGVDGGLKDVVDSVVTVGECMKMNFMSSADGAGTGKGIIQSFKDSISTGKDGLLANISSFGNDVVDRFKGFADKLSGDNLGSILSGNIDMDKLLGGKFDFDLSSLTSASDYSFTELGKDANKALTAAKKEFDAMLENYKNGKLKQADYDKQYTALLTKYSSIQANVAKYAIEKTLPLAKKEYDALLEKYKDGKIKQAKYDEEYLKILKKYKAAEVDLYKYAQGKMEEVVSKSLEDRTKEFEKKIEDIQKKIDKFSSKMTGSIDEMITYTTNKDIYDQNTDEYNKKLESLNEQHEKAIKLYGEESYQAQRYQKQIDDLKKSYEDYQKQYKKDGTKDDEIIGVEFTNKIVTSTKAINDYNDALDKLMNREGVEIGSDLIDAIGSMDRDKGLATVNYLNGLTDDELKNVQKNWGKYTDANDKLANTLYGGEMKTATEDYVSGVINELNSLPESATAIGVNIVKGLALGFSEETENSLSQIGQSSESIIKFIKAVFDIHSPSRRFRDEIGANLAKGLCSGFTDEMAGLSGKMTDAVPVDFAVEEADDSALGTVWDMLAELYDMVQNGLVIQPVIRPILDLSGMNTEAETIDTMMSGEQAMSVGSSFDEAKSTPEEGDSETPEGNSSSLTFNQYNMSPKALSRRDIYRATVEGLQLATAMR